MLKLLFEQHRLSHLMLLSHHVRAHLFVLSVPLGLVAGLLDLVPDVLELADDLV